MSEISGFLFDILFVILVGNFIFSIRKFPTRMNPASLYSFGFALAALMCVIYREEWDMSSFSLITFGIFILGVPCFTLYSYLLFYYGKPVGKRVIALENVKRLTLDNFLLLSFLFIQVVVLFLRFRFVMSTTGLASLSDALYDIRGSANQGYAYKIPLYLQYLIEISDILTYYFGFVAAKMFVNQEKGSKRDICLTIFVIGTLSSFFNGAKGTGLYFIIYYFIVWSVLQGRKKSLELEKNGFKKILRIGVGIVLLLPLFGILSSALGRTTSEDYSALYGWGIYCGAEIKNLDIVLNEPLSKDAKWGEYTFRRYSSNARKDKLDYLQSNHFVNGYYTGNVSSCLQFYYQDFGVAGVFLLVLLIAMIMGFLYKKSLSTQVLKKKNFSYSIFLFAYLGRGVAYSFFSERFYEQFLYNLVTIRLLILIAVLSWFVELNSSKQINKVQYGIK